MSLYRVVISFMRAQVHHMSERGVLAMTPGQALDQMFDSLNIDRTQIYNLKTFVNRPESLEEFSRDASMLACLGTNKPVEELWRQRHAG